MSRSPTWCQCASSSNPKQNGRNTYLSSFLYTQTLIRGKWETQTEHGSFLPSLSTIVGSYSTFGFSPVRISPFPLPPPLTPLHHTLARPLESRPRRPAHKSPHSPPSLSLRTVLPRESYHSSIDSNASDVLLTLRPLADSAAALRSHLPAGTSLLSISLSPRATLLLPHPLSPLPAGTGVAVAAVGECVIETAGMLLETIATCWRRQLPRGNARVTPWCLLRIDGVSADWMEDPRELAELPSDWTQRLEAALGRKEGKGGSTVRTTKRSEGVEMRKVDGVEMLHGAEFRGQAFDSFLLFQKSDVLFFIDQHAAHERVNLDAYLQMLREDPKRVIQSVPIQSAWHLTEAQMQTAWRQRASLEYWGYEISGDATTIRVEVIEYELITAKTVPSVDGFATTERDLGEYLDSIQADSSDCISPCPPAIRRLLAQRVWIGKERDPKACKNAVKFNTPLLEEDAVKLGRALFQCQLPLVCAHGRPTVMQMTLPPRRWSGIYRLEEMDNERGGEANFTNSDCIV